MNTQNNKYVKAVLKYLWLVVLAGIIGGGASYYLRSHQQPMYQSEVRMFIGNTINSPDPTAGQIDTGIRLASTYAQLITYDVRQQTITALDLPRTPDELQEDISTDTLADTPILVIRVTYAHPEIAASIANQIAEILVDSSPSNLTDEQLQRMNALKAQIDDLETQIAETNSRSLDALARINAATTDGDQEVVDRYTSEYNRLVDQLNSSRSILGELSNTFLTLSNRTNRLEIIERARPNYEPIGIKPLVVGIAGFVVAASLAVAALLYFEYSNSAVRSSEDVEEMLGLPVLARISNSPHIKNNRKSYLVTEHFPRSQIAEEYRTMRINLNSFGRTHSNPIVMVTSPSAREGKTMTATNLAVSLAFAGTRVLLIDADLRRPLVHDIFQLQNIVGLTTLLAPELVSVGGNNVALEDVVQKTHVSNLWVLTSGQTPARPTELLGSDGLIKLIDTLCLEYGFEAIVIDTPPCLVVSDASALAVATSASTVLVINSGQTSRDAAQHAKEQFEQLGVDIAGVVLNRSRVREKYYADPAYYHK